MTPTQYIPSSKKWTLLLGLCLCGLWGHGQIRPYFPFFQQEYFFGLQPSVRVEAMGRAGVALGGSVTSSYYNPAGIGFIKDWEGTMSTSGPFYALQNSDYLYTAFASRVKKRWVAGLSLHQFIQGPSIFQVNIAGERFDPDRPFVNDLALMAAGEVIPNLYVGINAHLFSWKLFEEVPFFHTFYFDAGAMYKLIEGDRQITLGAGLVNALGSELSFSSPINTTSSNVFPIILRIGGTYQNTATLELLGMGQQKIRYTATVERQDLINNAFRKAWRIGGEVILADALAIRLGGFTQTEDDMGQANNRARVWDITYGFGIILPFYKWWNGDIPLEVFLDYYALENPPLTFSGRRFSNKRGFALRIVSPLNN